MKMVTWDFGVWNDTVNSLEKTETSKLSFVEDYGELQ